MNLEEIENIRRILQEHEKRIKNLEQFFESDDVKTKKQITIRVFFNKKKPKNYSEKILCAGYYLENYMKLERFNAKDIEKCFREAKEKLPTNINDQINKLIQKEHIMKDNEEREGLTSWVLTNSGEKYVETEMGK